MAGIGCFIVVRTNNGGEQQSPREKLKFDFLPNQFFTTECMIPQKKASLLLESAKTADIYKRELSTGKIGEVCQLDVDQTNQVLVAMTRVIVSILRIII